MDLFKVDRYMGDDEGESGQRDETSRLAQLQRVIADRKRKRQSLGLCQSLVHDEENFVSLNNKEILSPKKLKSDAQEGESLPKKAREKKTKHAKEKSEKKKKKKKSSSEDGTSMDDFKELSVESDISADSSGGIKMTKASKKKDAKRYKDKGVSKEEKKLNSESNSEHKPDYITQEKRDNTEETPLEIPEDSSNETGFTVIGGNKKDKEVKKVHRVLPDWLAKPTTVNSDLSGNLIPVEKIPYMAAHIIKKLQQHDINHLFPVQSAVIPAILSQMETNSCFGIGGYQPSDICVSAPTGSGKTLAYVLPIVQSLLRRVVCHLRALVILPTKDLASQVKQVFEMFTEGTSLRVGLASGSKSFSKDREQLVNPR